MKKAFLLIVLIITPAIAFAQGTVALANQTGLVKQWTSFSDSTLISVPKGGGYVQLIAAPKGTALLNPLITAGGFFPRFSSLASFLAANPGWALATKDTGPVPAPIVLAGIFNGGTYTINNINEWAQADYFLIGWTGNYSSYDAAYAASTSGGSSFLGMSAIATTMTGDPLSTPPGAPVSLKSTFAGMTLGPAMIPDPPWIPYPPVSQQVTLGDTTGFYVGAVGTQPLTYQWTLNGASIPAATATIYTLTNAQYADAGTYTVRVANNFGSAGAQAVLQVLPAGGPSIRVNGQLAVGTVMGIGSPLVTVSGGFPGGSIFYTLDGSVPTTNSPPWTAPITLTNTATIQAMGLSADASQSAVSPAVTVQFTLPPTIITQPRSQTVLAGTSVTLGVVASGSAPLSYQWWTSLGPIADATNASYTLNPVQTNQAGSYSVMVSNPNGSVTSDVATLIVYVPVNIITRPASQAVSARATATFSVIAEGYPAPSYQWSFNGTNLPGATFSTLTITNVALADLGDYTVWVGNGYSSVFSTPATLNMLPSIVRPYSGVVAIWGRGATLSVTAIGTEPLSYQWFKDGAAIGSATNRTFDLPAVQFADAGMYSVVVSSPLGSVTNSAQLVINPANMDLGMYAGITLTGAAGNTYQIQYSTNLTLTDGWTTLTNLTLQQPIELWVDTSVEALARSHRYYRVLAVP